MTNDEAKIKAKIMKYCRDYGPKWAETRHKFTRVKANALFLGVLLDKMSPWERAWKAGEFLARNYFQETEDFWGEISTTHLNSIKQICRKGFEGKSFAIGLTSGAFPKQLKSAAIKIKDEYDSDVRNIWSNLRACDVNLIYDRFKEFSGVGDALAKMAQFILVRDYGVCGGPECKEQLQVKPDVHVRRVLFRLGICEEETTASVISNVSRLRLNSPSDFDWAVWDIGQNYCRSTDPKCTECPLSGECIQQGIESS